VRIVAGVLHLGVGLDPVDALAVLRPRKLKLKLSEPKVRVPETKRKGPRYTPVSKRQDRPNAILWLVRNHPELKDAQISRLVGTTKSTIEQIRGRTHWNAANLTPMDPVTLGLCTQIDLDLEVERAAKNRGARHRRTARQCSCLGPRNRIRGAGRRSGEKEIDADAVFAKLTSMKRTETEEEDEDKANAETSNPDVRSKGPALPGLYRVPSRCRQP
jgi:hypothetical protein